MSCDSVPGLGEKGCRDGKSLGLEFRELQDVVKKLKKSLKKANKRIEALEGGVDKWNKVADHYNHKWMMANVD